MGGRDLSLQRYLVVAVQYQVVSTFMFWWDVARRFFKRTGANFFYIFAPLGGFHPPMAQTKALAGVIAEMHCSIVCEMSTNSSNMRPGSILVNSAVRRNCGKIRECFLTVS